MRLDVQPEGYTSASEPLVGAHQSIDYAQGDLLSALAGAGAMAGQDSAGQAFAAQYDTAANRTVAAVGTQLDAAVTMLEIQDSPEIARAVAAVKRLKSAGGTLAQQSLGLGRQCSDFAQKVDDTRTHTTHTMEACLAGLAVTAVVGIGLTLVTFGGSDAAAAAADAEIVAAAEEVSIALEALITSVEELTDALEEAEGAGAAESSGDTLADADRVEQHLERLDPSPANDAMLERIREAAAEGRPLTEGEQNFTNHELTEAGLMDDGMSYEEAHEIATQQHPRFTNYDPEVIQQFPKWFNSNWLKY